MTAYSYSTGGIHQDYLFNQRSPNLFSALVRRAQAALAQAPHGSRLVATIWYQVGGSIRVGHEAMKSDCRWDSAGGDRCDERVRLNFLP
jgi:hypothetical protein